MQPLQGARGCVGPNVATSVPWVRDKQPACFGKTKPKTPCVHRTWVSAHTGVGGLPAMGRHGKRGGRRIIRDPAYSMSVSIA